MKYKVGDIVTVRKDLNENIECDACVVSQMLIYSGMKTTISNIIGNNEYEIECDEIFCWNSEMFEDETRETVATENISNMVSYIIDTQYSCYIKSQNVSTEEKMAVKKFIEFMRKNINETKDTEHYTEIK